VRCAQRKSHEIERGLHFRKSVPIPAAQLMHQLDQKI
jgi:hypothetical protein